jgi:hypothetical protein
MPVTWGRSRADAPDLMATARRSAMTAAVRKWRGSTVTVPAAEHTLPIGIANKMLCSGYDFQSTPRGNERPPCARTWCSGAGRDCSRSSLCHLAVDR